MLTPLLTRAVDGLGEDVSDSRRVLAENVGVDALGAAAMIAILPALQRRAGEDHTQGRASRVTCDALTGTLNCALGRIGICAYQTDGQERVSADGADCETAA